MATSIWVHSLQPSIPTHNTKPNIFANLQSPHCLSLSNINTKFSQSSSKRRPPPLYLSTNPQDINIEELRSLLTHTHQNCHRFPEILHDGSVKPVDPTKLRLALMNSSVVVSAHTVEGNPYNWVENFLHGKKPKKILVGFGRATSDSSLTASLHDLAIAPSLQRLGIGRKILQRIIRILTSQGIYDISVLCSEEQRPFFQACGFANDVLNSTTMFYNCSPTYCKGDECIKYFGRKSLLVPKPLVPFSLKR